MYLQNLVPPFVTPHVSLATVLPYITNKCLITIFNTVVVHLETSNIITQSINKLVWYLTLVTVFNSMGGCWYVRGPRVKVTGGGGCPVWGGGLELLWRIICWGWLKDEGNISSEAMLDYTLYGFVLAYHAPLICAQFSHNCILQDSDLIPLLDLVLLWFRRSRRFKPNQIPSQNVHAWTFLVRDYTTFKKNAFVRAGRIDKSWMLCDFVADTFWLKGRQDLLSQAYLTLHNYMVIDRHQLEHRIVSQKLKLSSSKFGSMYFLKILYSSLSAHNI